MSWLAKRTEELVCVAVLLGVICLAGQLYTPPKTKNTQVSIVRTSPARKVRPERPVKLVARRMVSLRVSGKHDFTPLYIEAGRKYHVRPELLASVHEQETNQSGNTMVVSTAGALGPMQFMPKTWHDPKKGTGYQTDGDGDGVKNIYDVDDAVYAAARYLAANGANRGNERGALWHYNQSWHYVGEVLARADRLGKA